MIIFERFRDELFTDENCQKISKIIDEKPEKIQDSLNGLTSLLLAAMMKRSSSGMAMSQLMGQLQKGNYTGDTVRNFSEILNDRSKVEAIMRKGESLVSLLYPGFKSTFSNTVATHAVVRNSNASKLLFLACPLLIDALGEQTHTQQLDTDALAANLVDKRDALIANTSPALLERMIPELGLQDLLAGRVNPVKNAIGLVDASKANSVENLQEANANQDLDGKTSSINIKKILPLLFLLAAFGIGGYYTMQYRNNLAAEQAAIDSTTIKMDTAAHRVDSVMAKPDSLKTTASLIGTPPTNAASTIRTLAKYVADTTKKAGNSYTIDAFNFADGSYELNEKTTLATAELADLLKKNPKVMIKLVGYATDGTATLDNKALALKRIYAIKKKLLDLGISNIRMDADSKGSEGSLRKIDVLVLKK